MHAVVNRLTFRDPIGEEVLGRLRDTAMPVMREAGLLDAKVVQTGERELVLVLLFESEAAVLDVTSRIGNGLMREHIVPLLDGPTDRRVGPVIVSMT